MQIGSRIQLRRRELGFTQKELARRTGVDQPNLSNIERGKQDLTVSTLRRIAHALDMPARDFFDDSVPATLRSGMTRLRLERLAKGIVRGGAVPAGDESIVREFRLLLPSRSGRRRKSDVERAWIFIRKALSAAEIRSLQQRIEDEKRRST